MRHKLFLLFFTAIFFIAISSCNDDKFSPEIPGNDSD